MPDEMFDVEIYLLVNESGDFVVHSDEGELAEAWDNAIGGAPCGPVRQITVKLKVPKPKAVVITGTVPAESNEGCELKVA